MRMYQDKALRNQKNMDPRGNDTVNENSDQPSKRTCLSYQDKGKMVARSINTEQLPDLTDRRTQQQNPDFAAVLSNRSPPGFYQSQQQRSSASSNSLILHSDDDNCKRRISEFFYENNISADAVASRSFRDLIDISGRGVQLQPSVPTVRELRYSALDKHHQEMTLYVDDIKKSWSSSGCSIILDGWVDSKGRTLMNVLVDCPQGAVYLESLDITSKINDVEATYSVVNRLISEVGAENVLQVVSYTASPWLDAVKERVNNAHQSIFWSTSATYCLTLILERVASTIDWVRETIKQAKRVTRLVHSDASLLRLMKQDSGRDHCYLFKPSKIKAASQFLTLENMLLRRKDLQRIFISKEWRISSLRLSDEGSDVAKLVGDKSFWAGVTLVVKGAIPLVNVINLINDNNNENKPQMGILYETLDQMKETISEEIGKKKAHDFWLIIDDVWNNILHSPLHAVGCYLNPQLFYTQDFVADSEVVTGLLITVLKIGGDPQTQALITQQLDAYKDGLGDLRIGIKERNKFPPAEWWRLYGDGCPELQRFALKVLGLTCNGASSYKLRRELAEKLLSAKETHPMHQWLKALNFVSHNLHLRGFKQGALKFDIVDHAIGSFDGWIQVE